MKSKLELLKDEVEKMKRAGLISGPGEKQKSVAIAGPAAVVRDGAITQWVKIIPAMAVEWLKHNNCNRPLRKSLVAAYARDMRSGNWAATHQGIAFGESGALLDGQHRLHAIIESGVPVLMMVTRGLPEKIKGAVIATMDAVDRGAVRSVADQMQIQHGISNSTATASAANAIAQVCIAPDRLNRTTVAQVLQILDVYGKHIAWAIAGQSTIKNLRTGIVLGAMAFARACWRKEAEEFYDRFVSGEGLGNGSAILFLRNRLIADAGGGGSHQSRLKTGELILGAVSAFRNGAVIQRLDDITDGIEVLRAEQAESVRKIRGIFE